MNFKLLPVSQEDLANYKKDEMVGGAIVVIDEETQHDHIFSLCEI